MDQRPDTRPIEALLPELSGEEALLLASLLQRLADAIWKTYGPDMGLALARTMGALPTDNDLDIEDDLPF